jgi:hypothetical protein
MLRSVSVHSFIVPYVTKTANLATIPARYYENKTLFSPDETLISSSPHSS